MIISASVGVLLFSIGYKYTKNPKLCIIFLFISMYIVKNLITCRAQIISLIIFILQYYCSKELLKTNKKRYYIILLILPIVLVNIHGTILPTYYIFYLPFIAEYILIKCPKISEKLKGIDICDSNYYKNLIIIIIINFFEGLISPNGIFPYIMNFQAPIRYYSTYIKELRTISTHYIPLFAFYFIIYFLNLSNPKAHESFMLFGLGIMGIIHIRSLLHFFLIGYIIIVEILNQILNSSQYKFIEKIKEKKFIANIANITIIIILVFSGHLYLKNKNQSFLTVEYPVNPTNYLLNNLDLSQEVLFNDFNVGSYLEYHGIKAFIDSRAEVFVKPFNDTTILKDSFEVYYSKDYTEYESFFNKYNFTIALIDKDTDLYDNILNNNIKFLKLLYEDNYFAIYRVEI